MLKDRGRLDETIVTTGVGQHQMWSAQYFHFNAPRRWITVFVASVVPWMINCTSPGDTAASAMTARKIASTPASGARVVVRPLAV